MFRAGAASIAKLASHFSRSGLAGSELCQTLASPLVSLRLPPTPSPSTCQAVTLMAPVAIWMWCSRRSVLSLSMK